MSCDSELIGRKMTLHFFRHFLWVFFVTFVIFCTCPTLRPSLLKMEQLPRVFFFFCFVFFVFFTETLIFIAFLLYQFVLISGYLFIDVFSFKKKTILSLVLYMNEVLNFDTMWLLLV